MALTLGMSNRFFGKSAGFEFGVACDILSGMNITLIGYRGSGKTSIGKLLAQKLWRDFVDTDQLIVDHAGMTIREIFAAEGEAGFRQREAAVVAEVAAKENQIIAAGGGAVLDPANVASLKRSGKIVWLKADPKTLHARIQADAATNANRPNLTAVGGIEEVERLLAARPPFVQPGSAPIPLPKRFR